MLGSVKLCSILVFHSLCLCILEAGRVKRVIGGNAVVCGTQPRIVSLRNATSNEHLCGATLLSARFALTAAHCVQHNADQYALHLNNNCEKLPRIKVSEVLVHELYNEYYRAHDIALIRLSHEFNDTAWLNSTVLPNNSFGLTGECTIFGYGYKEVDVLESSEDLLAGPMRIVSLEECLRRLGPEVAPRVDSGMLCALGTAGVDACQGDSGGPLICDGVVQAVSSYGLSCGVPGLPGVFTSVGAHLSWINGVINECC